MLYHIASLLLNGLRDYGTDEQIGLEETPEAFIEKLVEVFRGVKRVLRDDGTLWVNIGDSYAATNMTAHGGQRKDRDQSGMNGLKRSSIKGYKSKDLIGIPWMLAFALRADGWYLRQDIIWAKPNPMPESVTDRCTKSHEYIFLLSKNPKYYYDADAIKEEANMNSGFSKQRLKQQHYIRKTKSGFLSDGSSGSTIDTWTDDGFRNKRSVWSVATKPFSEAHFATFPEDLIVDMVKAGCPRDGVVLDPFMGAGTTALVARSHNRNYIGFELNPEYIAIAQRRLEQNLGMFK